MPLPQAAPPSVRSPSPEAEILAPAPWSSDPSRRVRAQVVGAAGAAAAGKEPCGRHGRGVTRARLREEGNALRARPPVSATLYTDDLRQLTEIISQYTVQLVR